MYNSQEIAKRIKNVCKTKNEQLGSMLSKLEMGVNTVSELGKGKQISYLNFAKIADYLDVSVDYLLGRTENPQGINQINTGNVGDNSNVNIHTDKEKTKTADNISEKFMEIFDNLPFEDQLAVMNFAVEKSKKCKEN